MDTELMDTLLTRIESESKEVDQLIQQLLAEMERVPPEQRTGADWGPAGNFAQRLIKLLGTQAELAKKLLRANTATSGPATKQ